MDELGHILREARETRGLTLAEVQSQTRINSRFLEALENGEYETLPTPVHVRGFLRNYARFLGLDPQPLLDRYEFNRNQRSTRRYQPSSRLEDGAATSSSTPLPPIPDQPFFEPVNMEVSVSGGQNTESIVRLLIIAALLVSLYLVGNRFIPRLLGEADGTETLTSSITEVWQSIIGGDETTEAAADEEIEPGPSSVLAPTGRNDFGAPAANDSDAPLPTRPPLPATMEVIQLRVDITERTFMEVTIDGDVVFSGNARRDDVFEWEAREEAKILTGNAIGVIVTINDIPLGRLGGRGEAKEEVWRTTN